MKHRHWLIIIAAPLLITATYSLLVGPRWAFMDWIVLIVSVAVGAVGIWSAPWRGQTRVIATIAYVPLMGFALAATYLFTQCATGNCL